jgi:hypothetical protein
MRAALRLAAVAIALSLPAAATAAAPTMAEARRTVAQLEASLLSRDSATETLRQWCAQRRLADPPRIVAERLKGEDEPADAHVRRLLQAAPGETVRHRRVALACGDHVLSIADNWYRPGALTPAMNAELDGTDHPFGQVVGPLGFHRVRLGSRVLMSPQDRHVPAKVLRQSALLETADGAPFSLVVETYTAAVLDDGSVRQQRTP